MPGFFRGLAKAAIDGYNNAKEQQAQAQREAYAQAQQQQGYTSPPPQYQQQWQQPQQQQQYQAYQQPQAYSPPPPPPRPLQPYQQNTHSPPPPPPRPQAQKQEYNVTARPVPASPPRTNISRSPGCNGLEPIQSQSIYITSIAPDLDICTSCYQTFIAHSPFASHFTLVSDPNNAHKTCDMAIKGVRNAWKEACARGSSDPNPSIWLQRFAQQSQTVLLRVRDLVATIGALREQIQLASLQAQFTQASAMNQIQHGATMSCINSIGVGSYYDGGSVIRANGSNRFAQATQMKMDVHMKEYELKRVVAEFRGLVGLRDLALCSQRKQVGR
ncbi:hypothetical protein PRZ48_000093 [Zasmidium cellare]|uniref:Uncharacterized protein n=1 Tax=Zasmidium cellare TaxID=395010 RepID=A0ABR0EZW8_ZASCE|nr:hypothetical protein PRZ48_000093 [Zasmidium cellare]